MVIIATHISIDRSSHDHPAIDSENERIVGCTCAMFPTKDAHISLATVLACFIGAERPMMIHMHLP